MSSHGSGREVGFRGAALKVTAMNKFGTISKRFLMPIHVFFVFEEV
jgi:hypothetical protein